jgi:hypothetical protein
VNVSFIGDRDDVLIRVREVASDQVTGTVSTDSDESTVSFSVTEVDKAVIQIEFNREE